MQLIMYDRMAEWLRRWPTKSMRNAFAGSNPASVDIFLKKMWHTLKLNCSFYILFIININSILIKI